MKHLNKTDTMLVAGAAGMVGSAIVRALLDAGHEKILGTIHRTEPDFGSRSRDRVRLEVLDLMNQDAVRTFFISERPSTVILTAARVGGIKANADYPAEFIHNNLRIACNVIHAAHLADVQHLLFLGSSCIYPRLAPQPMAESALLTGPLEPTNEPYAISKIAGIKLCESYNRQYGRDYRSVMPTNLYGPGDNFHSQNSHVVPALMRRFHEAVANGSKEVVIWGSGAARREFLHVDDMARACLHVMNLGPQVYQNATKPMCSHINVGSGQDRTIAELAEVMARVTGYTGTLQYDKSKPDGTPQKLLDISLLKSLGWEPQIDLERGLRETYRWFSGHNT